MERRKVVIVGGVAGGASAAARLRRLDENAEIVLFERGEHISFANCGLPYYVGEVIKDKEALLVQTVEGMSRRFNIDIRVNTEVTKIDVDTKEVEVVNRITKEKYKESFDKLILSPGAEPLRPPIPGINGKNIFTLRSIPDTFAVKDYVDQKKPKRAVVVGGGFIGLEMAENLHLRGVKVTVVEMADQVMAPLDYDMAAFVHQHLKTKGVEFYLKDGVKSFEDKGSYTIVELQSGKKLKGDIIILAIGVRPEVTLAKEAGLEIGERKGIKVNKHLQTSHPDIYAIGDAIEVIDVVNGKPTLIPLAGPANKQGRIAANHICGIQDTYKGTQGTAIVKVFDITVAATGNNEKTLKRYGIPYVRSYTHSASHAGYYPGAIPMSVKLLFSPDDGKVLGAQIVGYKGVDKRIDVLATAIRAGLTVYDLQELELAYAPPYSSAKDPVNMAGYVASNILNGDHPVIYWDELAKLDPEKAILVDVRTEEENQLGAIPGSINIPLDTLREKMGELSRDKEIIIYCQVGLRGYLAVRILMQNGFKTRNLSGGYRTWQVVNEKQSNEDIYDYDRIEINDEIHAAGKNQGDTSIAGQVRKDITVDACGLQCPGPIIQVFKAMEGMKAGEVLEVKATDPAFEGDVKSWCQRTGNKFLGSKHAGNHFVVYIRKEEPRREDVPESGNHDKTLVVFSGDLDKAIASFIIANGAASMGRKVTMFFTFWGLNILRKPKKVKVKKSLLERMFGMMMPRGAEKLGLSRMNMVGMGPVMIKYVMKRKKVDSLISLIEQARKLGVKMVACSMSMDVMGIKKEELIEGVTIGGVASYLGAAETADTNLFI